MDTVRAAQTVFVVLNPASGHIGDVENVRTLLETELAAHVAALTVYETTGEEDVAVVTRAAVNDGATLVIAAGGDGTVAAVVNGLIGSSVPIAILPVGTGNILARAIGIPGAIGSALSVIAGPHDVISLDAMKVGDTYFGLNVSTGISSRSMKDTLPDNKKRFGVVAYAWTILGHIIGLRPDRFLLTVDGRPIALNATEILVSNGTITEHPPFTLGPRETFADGRIEVYVVDARSTFEYIRLFFRTLFRMRKNDGRLRHYTVTESVRIASRRGRHPVQGDGEVFGTTPVEATVVPNAVSVVVPRVDGA